ncbi:MAG: ABC transporter ATP-binding protein [Blastochloris sp.]|nr:ABC transporter ATP-binding protein [Blastochloris sp.]
MVSTAVADARPEPHAPRADVRWLGRFVLRHRFAAIMSIVSGVVGGITAALEPYMVGVIIDHITNEAPAEQILMDVLLMIGLAIITVIAFWGQRLYSGTIAYNVTYDVRETLFSNLQTLDNRFFQQYPTGDLISRMYSDIDMIWRLFAIAFNRGGSAIFTLIMTFVLLGITDFGLTLVVFVVLAISTSFQLWAGMTINPLFERVQEQAGVMSALVQDSISGIQTIKTFGREDGVNRKFLDENFEYRRRFLFFKRRYEPVGMLPNMISQLTTGIVVLFGGILTLQGQLTIGNFTQFLLYLTLISAVLLQLGTIYQRYQQTLGALTRLTPLLQHATIADAPDAVARTQVQGELKFDGVGVQLEGEWVLRDISLKVEAGSVVAFVGPTGSGKTMLLNLLARVLDPTEGRMLVDGVDVRDWKLDALRRGIAYVPQTTFLFSQKLHENVRMGQDDVDDAALEEAIHIARVSNDLPQLPHGLETLVGEKGVMLSGGQKQRVAIARAIVRDPAILVLDDALSSVDTQTAADILGDLRGVLRTRTSLIIAHRIATVKDADWIVVMDNGRIVQQGTHADLVAHDGVYARMVERELNEEGVFDV